MTDTGLSTEATRLLEALRFLRANARAQAVNDARLSELTSLDHRDIIVAADELLAAGYPIVATSGHSKGLSAGRWFGTEAELKIYEQSLGIRAKRIMIRRRHVRDVLRKRGQLTLQLHEAPR